MVIFGAFEWDEDKEKINLEKHLIDFETAARAFLDPNRIIVTDTKHSILEERMFCIGKVDDLVLTVRFIHRGRKIRIIGAGIWRKEKKFYEKTNKKK